MNLPVIALFDIGKTNKKLFLIDEQYRIVLEKTKQFAETTDEDGEPCDVGQGFKRSGHDKLLVDR